MGYKKRKPFLVRLFLWIFWLAVILALIFGGAWAYLYFGKNVDLVGAIGQINAISSPVGQDAVADEPITEADTTSVETKTEITVLTEDITISGNEFGAYINKAIQNGITANVGGESIDLSEWNFEVIEAEFDNITGSEVDFNIVFKFDTENLKAKMNVFPLSMISLPETMFITSKCTISLGEDLEYTLSPIGLGINALSFEETNNILELISVFVANFDAGELNTTISEAFLTPLLGSSAENGLVQNLNAKAPAGFEANFHFETQSQKGVFVIDLDPAVYEVSVRQILGENNNANVAAISGTGEIYNYGDTATLKVTPNVGYNFEGWYSGSSLVCALETYTITNITSDMLVQAKFSYITKNITYISSVETYNPNPETYNISNGTFNLVDLTANGYKFLGWFTDENGKGNKVTSIDASALVDVSVYAHWEMITYSISYNLNNGVIDGTNPSTYTVETDTFTILNPTKDGTEFTGWTGTNLSAVTTALTIEKGSFGNLVFNAHYLNDTTVFLYVDGVLKDYFQVNHGEVLSYQSILSYSDVDALNSAAYTIQNWYTNQEMNTLYDFSPVSGDVSLYTTLEYFTDKLFFYPYLEEFDAATQNKTKMTFNSQDKLLAWIDYVIFYRVMYSTTGLNPTFNLTYVSGGNTEKKDEVQRVFREVYAYKTKFQTTAYGITYSSEGFFLSPDEAYTDPIELMASKTADPTHSLTEPQQDSALLLDITPTRSATFDDFKINEITKTVTVTNSEQLVHVLEQGYKPTCLPGSSAEIIYNKAKAVLREICTDDMTDFEKLRAIYEWLIINVQYDHYAAENITAASETRHYRAWFAEGVFLDKVAVCEGLAKATVILSRIENIPAIIVTNPTHAWNKVVVDGQWYGFDTTHGNLGVNGQEVLSYTKFLFPDSYRPEYVASEYPAQTATQTFNYYQKAKINHLGQTFDLVVDSQAEMTQIINYVALNQPNNVASTYFTIEIIVTGGQMQNWLNVALAGKNLRYFSNVSPQITNTGQTAYILIFYKS